ncbi:MAG: T9SS type A sorting domain-containing protein [Saprospiraceae bacterium]
MNFKVLQVLALLFLSWFLLTNSMLNPNNPPVSKTGAPGEATCSTTAGCHSGGTFLGTVTIAGVPDTVVADQTYTITLTNTSNAVRAGFQMTCWDGNNAMCGTFTAGTGVSIGTGSLGKKYPRQSSPKTLNNGSTSWTFSWKAPAAAAGNKATFYFVSLCANANGETSGDNALQSSKTVVLQSTSSSNSLESETLIKFFPTLVQQNTLYIELLEAQNGHITVFDLNGKIVLQQSLVATNELNVNTLAKGIYSARILVEGKISTKKFVVE